MPFTERLASTKASIGHYAKGVIAFLGFVATLVTQLVPMLPDDVQAKLAWAVPLATSFLVWYVPNAAKPEAADDTGDLPPVDGEDDVEAPADDAPKG
jgi:hypothetical protein